LRKAVGIAARELSMSAEALGEDDRLTPPEIGRAMHTKIPGSQFVLIPIAGHLSNIEPPEACNRAGLCWTSCNVLCRAW
jgi:hypothetical protein